MTTPAHIVVEGCDGTGKDHLIASILDLPRFDLHERASTSLGGPVADIEKWVTSDLSSLENRPSAARYWVYNRHPLISEPIYGPVRKVNHGTRGRFRDPVWVRMMSGILATHALLVVCQPPWDTVKSNLDSSQGTHMPGVQENARLIYDQYTRLTWPGLMIRYDYTTTSKDTILTRLQRTLASGN